MSRNNPVSAINEDRTDKSEFLDAHRNLLDLLGADFGVTGQHEENNRGNSSFLGWRQSWQNPHKPITLRSCRCRLGVDRWRRSLEEAAMPSLKIKYKNPHQLKPRARNPRTHTAPVIFFEEFR